MTYAEQIRHPSAALSPPRQKRRAVSWWWIVAVGIAALVLVAVLRPHWLGIHVSSGAGEPLGGIANPHGWV